VKIDYISASRINTYLNCPHQYYLVYHKNYWMDNEATRFGTLMHDTIEHTLTDYGDDINPIETGVELFKTFWSKGNLRNKEYFDMGIEIIKRFFEQNDYLEFKSKLFVPPEKKFTIELAPGVKALGFIDILLKEDKKTIHVVDFKTSSISKTYTEAKDDIQMGLYDLAISEMFPEFENVLLTLYYLRTGEKVTTTRTEKERNRLRDFLVATYYQIKEDKTHEKVLNNFCHWCPGKHECSEYKKAITEGIFPGDLSDESSLEELEKQYLNIEASLVTLKQRKDEINNMIETIMRATGKDKVRINNIEFYSIPQNNKVFDNNFIVEKIGIENFIKLATISQKALKDNFDKELVNEIINSAEVVKKGQYIKHKKIKNSPSKKKRKKKE